MAGSGAREYYKNFDDPIGVVRRMVTSRNPVALATLARAAARPVVGPISRRWARIDAELIAEAPPSDRPIVMVTGGARTGTSLTAQILAMRLDVDWFDNRVDLFPHSPLYAARRWPSNIADIELASYYGNSRRLGAMSDAFGIWNRWLGDDRYVPELRDDAVDAMRRFFDARDQLSPRPLLNKNNRNLPIAVDIARAIPRLRVVTITRDPLDTVASLLVARRVVQGDVTKPWGVLSRSEVAADDPLGYVDDVCAQVLECNRVAEQVVETLGPQGVVLRFEDVLADPHKAAEIVGEAHGVAARPDAPDLLLSAQHRRRSMTAAEEERAETVLDAASPA